MSVHLAAPVTDHYQIRAAVSAATPGLTLIWDHATEASCTPGICNTLYRHDNGNNHDFGVTVSLLHGDGVALRERNIK